MRQFYANFFIQFNKKLLLEKFILSYPGHYFYNF